MKLKTFERALCTAMLITAPFSFVYARHLTPNEALERIAGNSAIKKMPGNSHLNLVYTEESEGNEMVYVFNGSNGFVLAAADNNMAALLGYSDNGNFDYESAPPALKWMISQYASQASSAISNDAVMLHSSESSARKASQPKETIPYLIQTAWGQQYPFNLDCPKIGDDNCVTGCVATAMAQIVKYHAYPSVGKGHNQYYWNDQQLEFDYSHTSFLYDDMLDSYSSASSEEERNAVATLMSACGIAVDMQYDLEGSSATDTYIAAALRNFFGYDNETRLLKRDFFSDEEWEDLIYSELQQNRPVIYGGQAPKGGHQFICDGYDADGFFHINWGWAKLADGYYRLSALDPDIQGVGGFEGGYNSDQTIVCGIQPAREGVPVWYPIYSTGSLEAKDISSTSVNLSIEYGGLYNYSQESAEVELLLKAVNEDGKEYLSEPRPFLLDAEGPATTWLPFPGAVGTSIAGYSGLPTMNLPEDLPAGDYKCYIVLRTKEGNIQKIYFPRTVTSFFNLTIGNSGNISVTPGQPEAKAEIKVTGFEPENDVIQNMPTSFLITLENIGDVTYTGNIEYKIFKDGEQVNPNSFLTFPSLKPDVQVTYLLTLILPYEIGVYDFIFFDQYGDQISEPFTIAIGDSGVESIMTECQVVDVYTSGGILVKKKADRESVMSLPKGIYILKSGNKTYKAVR